MEIKEEFHARAEPSILLAVREPPSHHRGIVKYCYPEKPKRAQLVKGNKIEELKRRNKVKKQKVAGSLREIVDDWVSL